MWMHLVVSILELVVNMGSMTFEIVDSLQFLQA